MPVPDVDFENGVKVEFWIDDRVHALRFTRFIPAIGDEVRFKNIAYKVHYRIFIYDEETPRVAINMQEVRTKPPIRRKKIEKNK